MTKQHSYILYFSDLKRWFFKLRVPLVKIMGICFLISLFLLSLREPKYHAEATFRHAHQRLKEHFEINALVSKILPSQTELSAISLMMSKLMIQQVVQNLGLQMKIKPHVFKRSLNMGLQFLLELGVHFKGKETFSFCSVNYQGREALTFYIKAISLDQFEIYDSRKKLLAAGKTKELIQIDQLSFTLQNMSKDISLGKWYCIQVSPCEPIVNQLRKNLTIKPSKTDSQLLQLSFSHQDAMIAAAFVNQIMHCFQNFLKKEHEEKVKAQLAYLESREQDLMKSLTGSMEDYASYLKRTVREDGFTGLAQQVEMLAIPQQEYNAKLLDLDLELKRWKKEQDLTSLRQKSEVFNKQRDEGIKEQVAALDLQNIELASFPASLTIQTLNNIDLPTAHILYREYSKEMQDILKNTQEWEDILHQMKTPEFEISSLSPVLIDPVSQEMIKKAAGISLELRDELNRSAKEHERLQALLDIQKSFLSEHLKQRIHFADLKLKTLENQMYALRDTALFLVENEKNLVQEKLSELQLKIKNYPEKWKLENEYKFRKKLTKTMVESLTHLIESKMADQHLFQLESKPLDLAMMPEFPQKPHLFSFALLTALSVGLGYLIYQFFKSASHGFLVSSEGLNQLKQPYLGSLQTPLTHLKQLKETELNILRKAIQFIEVQQKGIYLILGNEAINLSMNLAELIALQGMRVLVADLTFKPSDISQGLWHFVEGADPHVCIQKGEAYDRIVVGSDVAFHIEWMQQAKFSKALSQFNQDYDLVLLASPASLTSAEARVLHCLAKKTLVVLHEETYPDLFNALEWEENPDRSSFGFMMCEAKG